MKKFLIVVAIAGGLISCNDNGTTVNIETDSARQKLDTIGERIEDKAGELWDSTKSKAKDLKDRVDIDINVNNKKAKDSVR